MPRLAPARTIPTIRTSRTKLDITRGPGELLPAVSRLILVVPKACARFQLLSAFITMNFERLWAPASEPHRQCRIGDSRSARDARASTRRRVEPIAGAAQINAALPQAGIKGAVSGFTHEVDAYAKRALLPSGPVAAAGDDLAEQVLGAEPVMERGFQPVAGEPRLFASACVIGTTDSPGAVSVCGAAFFDPAPMDGREDARACVRWRASSISASSAA